VTSPEHRVPLTLAVGDYDHVRDLASGTVQPDGIDLTCLVFARVEEMFFRFLHFREWEVSEVSLGAYAANLSRGHEDLVAIPAFPARAFRHSAIYVRADGSIREPGELAGSRVGVPAWSQTAAIWVRGLLAHQFGLRLEEVAWYQGGVDEPGREEPVEIDLPAGIRLEVVRNRSLNEMLVGRELDAVISARPPRAFLENTGEVRRLIDDHPAAEADYYRVTSIFPIMHVVAIRRDAFDSHPWIAVNLLQAFERAKRRSLSRVLEQTVPHVPLPWAPFQAREAQELLGEDFWPYGIDANRAALEALLDYAFEQGVCRRRLSCDELFPIEVGATYKG
jgi:4,5-dihydroxyphthalate decarboxylase